MAKGVASLRMYNATTSVETAWDALFGQVFTDLGWPVEVIPHAWPAPLPELWERPDLVCGFMCGLPFARHAAPVVALAAPVPSPARYEGKARFMSEFVVRAESGWTTIEETFGQRIGWMVTHSQSGYQAPRALLADFARPGEPLFAESIGPLDTPSRALAALRANEVDVTALDCYYLDLMRQHAPQLLDGVQTIEVTPWTPNPLLVASATLPEADRQTLVARLVSLHEDARYAPLLASVSLSRFVEPDVASYDVLLEMAEEGDHYLKMR